MLDVTEPQPSPEKPFVPPEPLAPRDAFVAATAIHIEHLEETIRHLQEYIQRLEKDGEATRTLLSDLAETVEQNRRFQLFQYNEKRIKELRIGQILRSWKEIKERLDRIEGPERPLGVLREATFAAVNECLTELARNQQRLEKSALDARRNALVLFGCIILLMVAWEFGWI